MFKICWLEKTVAELLHSAPHRFLQELVPSQAVGLPLKVWWGCCFCCPDVTPDFPFSNKSNASHVCVPGIVWLTLPAEDKVTSKSKTFQFRPENCDNAAIVIHRRLLRCRRELLLRLLWCFKPAPGFIDGGVIVCLSASYFVPEWSISAAIGQITMKARADTNVLLPSAISSISTPIRWNNINFTAEKRKKGT